MADVKWVDYEIYSEQRMSLADLLRFLFNSPMLDHCVYRGVSDSEYELIPSLFRDENRELVNRIGKRYTDRRAIRIADDCNIKDQCFECASILAFSQCSNRKGLTTTYEPDQSKKQLFNGADYIVTGKEFPKELIGDAALAQHYGLPTRFLDWTFDPCCALYFAARKVFEKKEKIPKSFAIYVANMDMVSILSNGNINFVTPKYSYNENIRAQTGTLSYVDYGDDQSMEKMPVNKILEKEFEKCKIRQGPEGTIVLLKVIVDYGDVDSLRSVLLNHGLTYDRFFPGYRGVVKGLIDKYGY